MGPTSAPTIRRRERKGGAEPDLGRSRGGWGSKLRLVTERGGKPIVGTVTAGQRHESPEAVPLLEQVLYRLWPDAVAGDKGDSSSDLRHWLGEREIAAVIPKRKDAMRPNEYDKDLYRERPKIEQTINRLKRFCRVATRYEKLTSSYLAMVTLAMLLEWL